MQKFHEAQEERASSLLDELINTQNMAALPGDRLSEKYAIRYLGEQLIDLIIKARHGKEHLVATQEAVGSILKANRKLHWELENGTNWRKRVAEALKEHTCPICGVREGEPHEENCVLGVALRESSNTELECTSLRSRISALKKLVEDAYFEGALSSATTRQARDKDWLASGALSTLKDIAG